MSRFLPTSWHPDSTIGDSITFFQIGAEHSSSSLIRIGVEPEGMVRLGLAHYNTMEEVEYLLDRLASY